MSFSVPLTINFASTLPTSIAALPPGDLKHFYQGVEECVCAPFEGLTKRLVLTQQQSYDMIRPPQFDSTEWIGETVLLEPVHVGATYIEILSPGPKQSPLLNQVHCAIIRSFTKQQRHR